MVDSAIGGKTSIDLGRRTWSAPSGSRASCSPTRVLATLPPHTPGRRGRAARHALPTATSWGLRRGDLALARDQTILPPELGRVIRRCAAIKCWTVSAASELTGERRCSTWATVGHAIEAAWLEPAPW
jgi:hypothetical protein